MSAILYLMCQYFDNTYFAEKKWQYCQKNFVEVPFLTKKTYLCREKVAILPKKLRKVRNRQIKRNFHFCS